MPKHHGGIVKAGRVKDGTPKVAKTNVDRKPVGKHAMRKKANIRAHAGGVTHINSKVNRDKKETQ